MFIDDKETKCCGNCKHHKKDYHEEGDWYCDNCISDYYTEQTTYDDKCIDFESRYE